MDKIRINLQDLLLCLSNGLELVSPKLTNHHQQVAYLSYQLSEELNLSPTEEKNLYFAALVHDIGALSVYEMFEILETEPANIHNHAFQGAKLLEAFKPMQEEANIIRYHHLPWNYGEGLAYKGKEVPYSSHILHLADRACAKIKTDQNVLSQIPQMIASIEQDKGRVFESAAVDALHELGKKEYIWLDLISPSPVQKITSGIFDILVMDIDDLIDLSMMFSQIIDFRSQFTARHSAGVAKTAQRLSELVGFSLYESKLILVAGYLHDLGKLAVSNEVLEKPTELNEDEFNQIRSHTYYTYQLLDTLPQFRTIKLWASYHHEKLNGNGYPFHIKGENLTLGSRIMAVADIFTAVTENRPYRVGMDNERAIDLLKDMVADGSIDKNVVKILINNIQEINDIREKAQQQASAHYESFLRN